MDESEFRVKRSSPASLPPQPLALVNARLIDPALLRETLGGVLVVDGLIRDFGATIMPANLPAHARIIDCGGDCVAPGLIDMWAFIGEAGAEHRETMATATLAGGGGGLTTKFAPPPTNPPGGEWAG